MILDIYNKFRHDPSYKKVVGTNYMILEYNCPIELDKMQVLLECNFITYVISGKKDWIVGGKAYQVKEGEAIFLRKGVYTIRQFFDVDHCILVFFIHDDLIRKFMHENKVVTLPGRQGIAHDQVFELDVDESLQSLFYNIFTYLKMRTNIPESLVELKFKELLFNIVLNPRHKKLLEFFSALKQSGNTDIDDVMLKNFQYDLELDDFARLCGRSLSTFKREFRSHYSQTPGKWLTDKRLEYASALLLSSQMNINEIGYESGFRNSSHFNKTFKEKYHVTPKQFRSMHRPNASVEIQTEEN